MRVRIVIDGDLTGGAQLDHFQPRVLAWPR